MNGLNETLLVLHFLGLAMGLSVPLANATMMRLISAAEPPDKAVLGRFPPVMSRVGTAGIALLWLTGLTMVYTRWGGFATLPPMFHVKLAAVVLLTVTVGYIKIVERRVARGETAALATIQKFAKVAALFAVLAVVLAVITFN